MPVAGYIIALFIGISLGTIGGGGSILTVPVLIYFFGVSPVLATSYSLFIVGVTSGVGAVRNVKYGLVNHRVAVLFGCTSTLIVFIIRRFIIPRVADTTVTFNRLIFPYSFIMMLVFSLFMITAAWIMIRDVRFLKREEHIRHGDAAVAGIAVILGLVTGFLGIGGGFIIVPALVLVINLPMKEAVGTSLAVITFGTLVGFINDSRMVAIDWKLLLTITAVSLAGLVIGLILNHKLDAKILKRVFGWFVLVVGCYIFAKELSMHV